MEFKNLDYDQCQVNPFKFSLKTDLIKECEVFHFEEFTKDIGNGIKRNTVLRYIILAYDKNTPLTKLVDHNKIKTKAAELAGFKKNKNGWSVAVQAILFCENANVNDMIIRYVRNHNNHTYSYFVAMQEEYYRLLRNMQAGVSDSKSVDKITKVRKELEDIKSELLNGDKTENLEEKLAALSDYEELKLRPEDIADRIQANEPAVETKEIQ